MDVTPIPEKAFDLCYLHRGPQPTFVDGISDPLAEDLRFDLGIRVVQSPIRVVDLLHASLSNGEGWVPHRILNVCMRLEDTARGGRF